MVAASEYLDRDLVELWGYDKMTELDALGYEGFLPAGWRAQRERRQEQVLPSGGRVVVSCAAPFASGGLGRHLGEEIVEAIDRRGDPAICLCRASSGAPSQSPSRRELRPREP